MTPPQIINYKKCCMFLNDVVWGETATHTLQERGIEKTLRSKKCPSITKCLAYRHETSYIYVSTSKYKIKSRNNLLNLILYNVIMCLKMKWFLQKKFSYSKGILQLSGNRKKSLLRLKVKLCNFTNMKVFK